MLLQGFYRMLATENRTLHFDLSHVLNTAEFWLSAGAVDYPLVQHTEETRQEARRTNQALAIVPAHRITHYVKDVALPAQGVQILMVHSQSRTGGRLPTVELTAIHMPAAARKRAVELALSHKEHPAHKRELGKLSDAGIPPVPLTDPAVIDVHDWKTAMDAAVSLVFCHQEMMSLDPETAAIVHLQIEYSNGIVDLAASILRQARDHSRDPEVPNYVYEASYLDPINFEPNGEPRYAWTETTTQWAQGPMVAALAGTKNDPSLQSTTSRSGTWSLEPGTTSRGLSGVTGSAALEELQRVDVEAQPAGWTAVNLTAGNGLEIGDLAFDGSTLTLPLKNNWLRWLSVYVQFIDAEGKPFDPPDWKPIPPGPDHATKKYIGMMASAATILAIPLPSSFVDIDFPMPKSASKVNYFAGGLGRVNGIDGVGQWDADVCAAGTAMTAVFNLGIPAIGLVAGFSVSLTELNVIAKAVIKEIIVVLRLYLSSTAAGNALAKGDRGMWLAVANALVMASIAASPALSFWIIAKFTEAIAKKAAPIIGWIATAVSSVADLALITQTSVEVALSPATFTITAERKMNIDITMLPDVKHQNQWPATATHYRVMAQYAPADLKNGLNGLVFPAQFDDSGTMTEDFPMTVREGPIRLVMKDAPAGGTLTLIASFYSNTNWLCGHYKSDPIDAIPGDGNTLTIPAFHITEELVPLNADTYYAPMQELLYDDGIHQWILGRFEIREAVAALSAALDAGQVTTQVQEAFLKSGNVRLSPSDKVNVTRQSRGQGDQWLITGTVAAYHVNLIKASQTTFLEVTPGNAATVKNLDGSNVGNNLSSLVKITMNQDSLRLGYTWQASGQGLPLVTGGGPYSGQMFTFQDIGAGASPQSGLKFVPQGFPTRPVLVYDLYGGGGKNAATFYVDPRDERYHVRKVDLSAPGPFDLSTGASYGRFNLQVDAAAIHPNGYIVALNTRGGKLEVLPLMKQPFADSEAPVANLYGGPGSRPGLINNAVGLAISPSGVILVLENGNEGRVQAFDYLGNPVFAFDGGTTPYLRLRAEPEKVTCLDIATEVKGAIYVLKYLGEGRQVVDYRLDIYTPDGTFVSQTVAVNAGRMCVSLWREMFTLNFNVLGGPNGRTEPSVSEWIPSTPQGTQKTLQAERPLVANAVSA
jgi:hypothetical protein